MTRKQIEGQSLDELQVSLTSVNHAIENPNGFGVVRVKMTAEAGMVVVRNEAEAHFEMGILPILLERKALILERISALRPTEQVQDIREEVAKVVTDENIRDHLLKILDDRAAKERDLSTRIEKETEKNSALLWEVTHLKEISVGKIQHRLDNLEESTRRLESEKVSKFEAVTITFTILGAMGGLAALVLGLIRWTTG
ncbi:hypothetical protein G6045_38815 [Streptomyces sp. YC504]|uniref:Uncharacterized protein n=1 Tax=Streptomyces mesophilus TaxID=1775132 RepID=A0A6G4XVU5_9ACTN|nr:hypothetical protein [Streptomyces mesophilus]NGO81568.1 hypothetical protein [Streptomyces mesophilus]